MDMATKGARMWALVGALIVMQSGAALADSYILRFDGVKCERSSRSIPDLRSYLASNKLCTHLNPIQGGVGEYLYFSGMCNLDSDGYQSFEFFENLTHCKGVLSDMGF